MYIETLPAQWEGPAAKKNPNHLARLNVAHNHVYATFVFCHGAPYCRSPPNTEADAHRYCIFYAMCDTRRMAGHVSGKVFLDAPVPRNLHHSPAPLINHFVHAASMRGCASSGAGGVVPARGRGSSRGGRGVSRRPEVSCCCCCCCCCFVSVSTLLLSACLYMPSRWEAFECGGACTLVWLCGCGPLLCSGVVFVFSRV